MCESNWCWHRRCFSLCQRTRQSSSVRCWKMSSHSERGLPPLVPAMRRLFEEAPASLEPYAPGSDQKCPNKSTRSVKPSNRRWSAAYSDGKDSLLTGPSRSWSLLVTKIQKLVQSLLNIVAAQRWSDEWEHWRIPVERRKILTMRWEPRTYETCEEFRVHSATKTILGPCTLALTVYIPSPGDIGNFLETKAMYEQALKLTGRWIMATFKTIINAFTAVNNILAHCVHQVFPFSPKSLTTFCVFFI